MAIEGPLKELGFQDVLQLLELARKTGILAIRSERLNDDAVVHFDRGDIVFAMRRRSTRRIGQLLLRAGKLTERELERALAIQQQNPGPRLAEILLEMGSVTEPTLKTYLRFQVEETIYDLMSWDEGRFRFDEEAELRLERVHVRVRVDALLMEGARRIDEWSRIEAKVPGATAVPVLAPATDEDSSPLRLRPEEWEVLAEVDGGRDIRRIAADLGRSTFDVAKIIHGLVATGVLRVHDGPIRAAEQELDARLAEAAALFEAGDVEAAGRRVVELQSEYRERPEPALLAGRVFTAQGRWRAATEAFARAVELDPLLIDAHYHLGYAASRVGDFARAVRAWEMFLRLAQDDDRRASVEAATNAVRALVDALNQESTLAHEAASAIG